MEYRYRDASEMKDSGIEWIGKIPKDWGVLKIKRIIDIINGNGFPERLQGRDNGDIPFYKVSDINFKGNYIFESNNYVDLLEVNKNKWNIIKPNTIIIPKIGEALKKNHRKISTTNCLIDNNMCGIASKGANIKYLLYLFKLVDMEWYINPGAVPSINISQLKDDKCMLPGIVEQEKIANFLDKKTSQFDSIISKKEALIEKLEEAKKSLISEVVTGKVKVVKTDDGYDLVKRSSDEMKDSGVEWLGEIPKDWEVSKFKYILSKIGSGKTPKGGAEVYQDEGIVFIRSQNVHNTGLKLNDVVYISDEVDEEMKNSRVEKNDVLLNITGASIGRTSIFEFKDISANVNQHVCILRPIHKYILPRLLNKIIQSDYVQEQIQSMQTGSSREGLNFEQIANMNIVIDKNIENQQMIVKCLDEKVNSINNIINKTKLQIEKLKEAKQSLISEVVTGKIEALD